MPAPTTRPTAGGGSRTHTLLPGRDFESRASANSATPAVSTVHRLFTIEQICQRQITPLQNQPNAQLPAQKNRNSEKIFTPLPADTYQTPTPENTRNFDQNAQAGAIVEVPSALDGTSIYGDPYFAAELSSKEHLDAARAAEKTMPPLLLLSHPRRHLTLPKKRPRPRPKYRPRPLAHRQAR